jgi:hypothetical protein
MQEAPALATLDDLIAHLKALRESCGGDTPVFIHRAAAFHGIQISRRRCPKRGTPRLVTHGGRPCAVFHAR